MELLLLVLLLVVFILPSFLMMRSQRRRQAELQTLQSSLGTGDRVVTVAGIHATIVAARETQVDVEISPNVVVTMDRIAIMRKATPEDLGIVGTTTTDTGVGGEGEPLGYQHPEYPETPEYPEHPENR